MENDIKEFESVLRHYVKLLKMFDAGKIEKAEYNDFYTAEEQTREHIIKELNRFKEDYF